MPTLSIRFTGGHYHATPWDKAQNEGAVEWPPSPWRVLRALVSTGYCKLPEWQSGEMPDIAKSLFAKLLSILPAYWLPSATGAHTRHYMPIKGSTTLVLDARAVVGTDHAPLLIRWDAALTPDEEALLASLAEHLGYLGRAESWCEAAFVPDDTPVDAGWCVPSSTVGIHAATATQTVVLIAPAPDATVEQLLCETGALQENGWTHPPGSRKALYHIPARNAIGTTRPAPAARPSRRPVEFMLFALSSSARSRSPMPLAIRTLPQAELLHRALASHVGKLVGDANATAARELLGIGSSGHRHAHILPLSLLATDNHLDHILVWAPGGLGGAAQDVLRRIRRTYMKGGVGELSVRFVGTGTAADFASIPALRPTLGPARVWQSLTPLVLPRFRKKNGKNALEGQIAAELASRGLPAYESIELLKDESIAFRHHVRCRRDGSQPPEDFGYALRLTFAEPVSGPLCLGHSSHFGLGLFAPADSGGGL
jgi:CRISPR-associated protein Csb2